MTPLRRLALFVLAVVIGLSSVPMASSRENETFGVTPYPEEADGVNRTAFRIPLETGATFEDAIRIYNQTVQDLELTVYAADAEAGSGETDISPVTVGFRNDEPTGVGSWIDLARESVQLAPRDEVILSFRVQVKSADPKPANGAIVVETRGNSTSSARREFLTVLSVPGGTETTSTRVRPLLLRSPWIVVAILGLLVAIALVWIGARRARRPKDVLVPAGEIEQPEIEDDIPVASRPVIKRLGTPEPEPLMRPAPPEPVTVATRTTDRRPRRSARDDKPLLEDAFLVEVDLPEDDVPDDDPSIDADLDEDLEEDYDVAYDEDEDDEDDLPPARSRPAAKRSQPAARKEPAGARKAPARSASASGGSAKKKPAKSAARKKTVRPAAKTRTPARKAAPAKRAKPKPSPKAKGSKQPRGFIPLDDL